MTEENKPSAEEFTTIQPIIDTNQAGASEGYARCRSV
jgi:DNA gyrase subunit B